MQKMNVSIPEIEIVISKLNRLERKVLEIEQKIEPRQEWYNLREACTLKGLNYNSVSSRPQYQPNRGQEDAIIAGRKRWRRKTILSWLDVTDSYFKDQN
jgi:hypothetical protein